MPRKTQYNKITSDEKLALLNIKNIQLKNDFLLYLRSLRRSEGTISGYDSDLNIVFTYIYDSLGDKDFKDLTKRDIISIQNWMISNGCSSSRVRRVKAAISSLSNYVENILADDDPEFKGYRAIVRKIENPPLQPVREKTIWTEEELKGLLDWLSGQKEYEKACLIALAVYSGRRKAELCRFKVSDFGTDHLICDGALYKSSPIKTKGNKMLECYTLAKRFDPYLKAWLKERDRIGVQSEWLFPNPHDPKEPISSTTLSSWAYTIDRHANKPFYLHGLRHFFVTYLSREGIPDNVVVQILGWSSAEMFNIYCDSTRDEQIANYFKDGDIDTSKAKGFSDI